MPSFGLICIVQQFFIISSPPRLVFTQQLGDLHLSAVQQSLLAGLGLQYKTVDQLAVELDIPASQLLGLFNRCIRKLVTAVKEVQEAGIKQQMKVGGWEMWVGLGHNF